MSACIIQAGKSVSFERGRGGSLAVSPSSINHFSPPCKKQCIAGLARDEARLESARRYLRVQKRHEYARVHTHTRARASSFNAHRALPFIFIHPRLLYIHSRVNSNHSGLGSRSYYYFTKRNNRVLGRILNACNRNFPRSGIIQLFRVRVYQKRLFVFNYFPRF